ncbi:small nuclear ribonucleoprotein [Colletotrichum karsti]|uniref:Sm protein F n=1 Tax=Colletotrichum karsti TaxID=1095194 RepID=A0A9P6I648_9PEZI|nr:small nuclear ribonucleoprotein [Colletotrichum karsti]KAF9877587.1 small nuclear ribonucleoprotein [Colletotrichum karsti]
MIINSRDVFAPGHGDRARLIAGGTFRDERPLDRRANPSSPIHTLHGPFLPFEPPTMSFVPINPRPMLQDLVDKDVVIRLKWGDTEYKGKLVSIDSYMNIQLSGAEEYIDQKMTGALGQVLIRCNNVLWIRGAKEGERDVKMED